MEQSIATSQIFNADCLEKMKDLDDSSVDLIFCDLPYGQTSCKWDSLIDLEQFWIQVMRIKKLNTPIFFTTTTKFGVSLIQSAPKKCFFRYDLVWVKSAPAGFLCAKKMPMRKHEMIYVFYEKLPFYDLSSHKHKFLKEVKQEEELCKYDVNKNTYGGGKEGRIKIPKDKKYHEAKYEPPLPVSVVKEDVRKDKHTTAYGTNIHHHNNEQKNGESIYDPPLPVSVVKQESSIYGGALNGDDNADKMYQKAGRKNNESVYDPPLPVSVVKQEIDDVYDAKERFKNGKLKKHARHLQKGDDPIYEPPLPNSMLEIKSTRGKHSTEKPVALMEWIFKYYSKEGDVILDPTMGSGSTGIACKNMNRNFIGIEMDEDIFKVAESRLQ